MLKHFTALFGNVALERGYCSICKEYSFIRDGKFVLCNHKVRAKLVGLQRESEPRQIRHQPSKKFQDNILMGQNYSCFYCDSRFGSVRYRHSKSIVIKIHWDHQVPYSFSRNNHDGNFVASCQVCNAIKHNKMFQTIDEAKLFLSQERKKKGYNF